MLTTKHETKMCCTHCGAEFGASTSVFGNYQPSDGDLTICKYCLGVSAFAGGALVAADVETLDSETRGELDSALALMAAAKIAGGQPRTGVD